MRISAETEYCTMIDFDRIRHPDTEEEKRISREFTEALLERYKNISLFELNQIFTPNVNRTMIYTEQLHVLAPEFQKVGEEGFYKQMIQSIITMIPMHQLKTLFPLEIKEQEQGYSLRIKIEL